MRAVFIVNNKLKMRLDYKNSINCINKLLNSNKSIK